MAPPPTPAGKWASSASVRARFCLLSALLPNIITAPVMDSSTAGKQCRGWCLRGRFLSTPGRQGPVLLLDWLAAAHDGSVSCSSRHRDFLLSTTSL